MRTVVVRDNDGLPSWKELDRFLERHALDFIGYDRERSSCTYPPKNQGHLQHEVGGEYNQEVPRCILRHGSQNGRNLDRRRLRPYDISKWWKK